MENKFWLWKSNKFKDLRFSKVVGLIQIFDFWIPRATIGNPELRRACPADMNVGINLYLIFKYLNKMRIILKDSEFGKQRFHLIKMNLIPENQFFFKFMESELINNKKKSELTVIWRFRCRSHMSKVCDHPLNNWLMLHRDDSLKNLIELNST